MFRLFIAFRYIQGKTGQLLSVNARVSFLGVFTGMVLLVMVLSVFNGFQTQVRESIMGFDPHIKIGLYGDEQIIRDYALLQKKIEASLQNSAKSIEPEIQSPAIFRKGKVIEPVVLRTRTFHKKEDGSLILPDNLELLTLPSTKENHNDAFLGQEMRLLYHLDLDDTFDLIVPRGQFSLRVGITPSRQTFRVAGFFKTGNYNYDSNVILVDHDRAQKLFKIQKTATQSMAITLENINELREKKLKLMTELPIVYSVRTIEDEQRNFFAALQLEKTIMTVIVFLLIIAAMLFILVSIFNTVRSRRKDIGVLKAMGASSWDITIVFLLNGFAMGMAGALLGVMTGIFLALNLESIIFGVEWLINGLGTWAMAQSNELWLPVQLIPRDVYYFDHLPIHIDLPSLHTMGTLAVFLSGVSSAIPAWYAGKMEAIDILRKADS